MIKEDRESGSIIRSTAKEFRIGTRERQKNSTEQVAPTQSSHGKSFADGRSREDKTLPEAESEIAGALGTAVESVIGVERAVKEELATAELWEIAVALATVEGQVIEVARVNSAAVAGPVEAMPEAEAAPLKASIAAGVPPEAPASVAAPVAAALVVVEELLEVVVAGHEVEGAAEDGAGKKCRGTSVE